MLHLGDFVYEVVDYPEDSKDGHRYDRRLRDVIRYKNGEKVANTFHVPTTLEDYRSSTGRIFTTLTSRTRAPAGPS